MPTINKTVILGLVRHVLTLGAGFLIAKGLANESNTQELVGGLMAVIGSVWSMLAPEKQQA